MIRLLLVDDQPVVRRGLRALFETAGDVQVVGEASGGRQAVAAAARLAPDVVLMDVRMPGGDGIAATRDLAGPSAARPPAVVVLTTFDLDEYIFGALEAGASGFVLKDAEPEELLAAVRAASRGQAVVAPAVTRRVIAEFARRRPAPGPRPGHPELSRRELEVVRALARGMSNEEIAADLHIEVSTVKSHLVRITARLGVRGRLQLVAWAYRRGLVPLD